jgi:nucleoside-diphosphate-sugar epimerase
MTAPVALLGAHGFLGSAISLCLREAEVEHVDVASPRVVTPARDWDTLLASAARHDRHVRRLCTQLTGCRSVINAAGIASATERASDELYGANSLLPLIVARACDLAGIQRLVHISSAAVQGRRTMLDQARHATPLSPYAASKALGERAVLSVGRSVQVVVYRPTSVHGFDRSMTRTLSRLARSPLSSVAGAGTDPTPQVLVENVADAICFVAMQASQPPPVVLHPWEGWTTSSILELFGRGRQPHRLPRVLARGLIGAGRIAGRMTPRVSANVRRVELLWMGQRQVTGWLPGQGWAPPIGLDGWRRLAGRERATASRQPR